MANKRRDDFSANTIDILAKRVTYCCSNPSCQKATAGPNANKNKYTNVGVAAHIKAAANGGPRYDATMTSEERSDITNGIWLCQTCSRLVDVDEETYTVELLSKWKELAEKIAEKAISSDGSFSPNSIFEIALEDTLNKELEINKDMKSTVLTTKMKDGEFDAISILNAKDAKIHAIGIIRTLKTTETGRKTLNKIYSEVKVTIMNNIYMKKNYGDLLKNDMGIINDEMAKILENYDDKPCIDIKFIMGLIYIATSNCAMRWKYGSEIEDETNN